MLLLTAVLPLLAAGDPQEPVEAEEPTAQEQVEALLASPVLRQDDRSWTARDVVDRLAASDSTLMEALAGSPEYAELYLSSPRFYDRVRWFSNLLLLDASDIRSVPKERLLAEAAAWAVDHARAPQEAAAVLATHPFEIEARARLLALQPEKFDDNALRGHFHKSVPEFYGRARVSWIALPLFDPVSGRALGETERHARYALLDEVAAKLGEGELEWEDAVEAYDEDPRNAEEDGAIGWIKRTDVKRFEPDLLRQVFHELGFTKPSGALLRGPVLGRRWIYLVRVEDVQTQGVVEMNRVRDRVERSLRDAMLHERLRTLGRGVERSILLPPTG